MSEPGALNVWAPALYYEPAQKRWLIFWASTIPGRFPGDDSGDSTKLPGATAPVGLNHRIFSTTTADFRTFTPAKLFFDPAYSVIDATILPPIAPNKPFTLIFNDERKTPEPLPICSTPRLHWRGRRQLVSEHSETTRLRGRC
jgi:hypothetical protein